MPSESPSSPSETREPKLWTVVGGAANRLQDAYLGMHGDRAQARSRATLAELRRAAGRHPSGDISAWQTVLELVAENFPEQLEDGQFGPSRFELAAFDALTMFGLHMQSAQQPMHLRGVSFGRAAGKLVEKRDSASIKPRFDAALAVKNEATRRHHIRGLVSLLRTEHIGLDYGRLAQDLVTLSSKNRNRVLLAWGRDFANARFHESESK